MTSQKMGGECARLADQPHLCGHHELRDLSVFMGMRPAVTLSRPLLG
ncbi:hypothetical protein [Streptomyces sp. CA-106131]